MLTTAVGTNIVISWNAASDGGSAFLKYLIYIQNSDGLTYSQDLTNCNGASAVIIAATECSIPKTTLNAFPFELAWGVSVYARVVAVNIVGDSPTSTVGNGAYILTYPASPINFANDPKVTTAS